jgi:hypothetical protein
MISIPELYWVTDKVNKYCRFDNVITSQFKDDLEFKRLIRLWLIWANRKGFIHVLGDPPIGCVIARPCNGFSTELSDFFFSEEDGDSLWVDFLWAPHNWPAVRDFLISTGKLYGGWERRDNFKVHTIDIRKLCSRHIDQKVKTRSVAVTGEHGIGSGRNGYPGTDHINGSRPAGKSADDKGVSTGVGGRELQINSAAAGVSKAE